MRKTLEEIIVQAATDGASDIHLTAGQPPKYRLHGQITSMNDEPLSKEDCIEYAKELVGNEWKTIEEIGELDAAKTPYFAYAFRIVREYDSADVTDWIAGVKIMFRRKTKTGGEQETKDSFTVYCRSQREAT